MELVGRFAGASRGDVLALLEVYLYGTWRSMNDIPLVNAMCLLLACHGVRRGPQLTLPCIAIIGS